MGTSRSFDPGVFDTSTLTMIVTVIGPGYVGLPTASLFAELGNKVFLLAKFQKQVDVLKQGRVYIHEPGLAELFAKHIASGAITPTLSPEEAIATADVIIISVGTPSGEQGEADLTAVFATARQIGQHLRKASIIVNKSTVPVGTADRVRTIIREHLTDPKLDVDVAASPDFMREGTAVQDTFNPERLVLGVASPRARDVLLELYVSLPGARCVTDLRSAEFIKYASNAFLATKISFINEIATICENVGADVEEVARGMGLDSRIGSKFLKAGIGWSGSCFPKDVRALHHIALSHQYTPKLLQAVVEVNNDQRRRVAQKLATMLGELNGKRIALFGLSFKPHTNDARESIAIELAQHLLPRGARVVFTDPVAKPDDRPIFRETEFTPDPYAAATDADAIVIVTEWPEFRALDWGRLKGLLTVPRLIDGRNFLDASAMRAAGWRYEGVGRPMT